jgi:peptidoglycan/LPS O-acetylase OafA/YrhL
MIFGRSSESYRADIDGLRALAVLATCAFHAGIPGFGGGFVGVDVFFVISGYLTARAIGERLLAGDFSVSGFYERRARRILPAALVMFAGCALTSLLVVPPKLLRDFGATLSGALGFASNVVLWWKSANYFDAPNEWNPLLHTWSLAVEEQYYLLFPLFFWFIFRLRVRARFVSTALVAAASLGLGVWATAHAPTAAFYLLPARAWELLAGALLALAAQPSLATPRAALWSGAASALGLGLVLASLLGFNRELPVPGLLALVPCLGAGLLLHFGRGRQSFVQGLLAFPPLPFVGKLSYSLYLWHWPLLVFAQKYRVFGLSAGLARPVALAASLPLAWLSWRWVEQPFRSNALRWTRPRFWSASAVASTLLGLSSALIIRSGGWPSRFPGLSAVSLARQGEGDARESNAPTRDSRCFLTRASDWEEGACWLNRGPEKAALLWGDSFAAHYAEGFVRHRSSQLAVLEYTSPQCPPIIGYEAASRPECAEINRNAVTILSHEHISTVILVANWRAYFKRRKLAESDLGATVDALRRAGLTVVLVGQSPVFSFAYPDEYFYETYGASPGTGEYSAPVDLDPSLNARLSRSAHADVFFDPLALWCNGASCRFKQAGRYLFVDQGHYSRFGSELAAAALLDAMARSP